MNVRVQGQHGGQIQVATITDSRHPALADKTPCCLSLSWRWICEKDQARTDQKVDVSPSNCGKILPEKRNEYRVKNQTTSEGRGQPNNHGENPLVESESDK